MATLRVTGTVRCFIFTYLIALSVLGQAKDSTNTENLHFGCQSRIGHVVDWWLMYKLTKFDEYHYVDSSSAEVVPMGTVLASDDASPLKKTVALLIDPSNDEYSYFAYSNELNRLLNLSTVREHTPHSHGLLASTISNTGFWITHNDSHFPPSKNGKDMTLPGADWGWANSASDLVTYLCISIREENDKTTVLKFLSQQNPFTYLENVNSHDQDAMSRFLQRSQETDGNIYLNSVFQNYKQCLRSFSENNSDNYEDCLKTYNNQRGGLRHVLLLSKNKAAVGDVCLDLTGTLHLRRSLLPPIHSFIGMFAVVGGGNGDIICIGDLTNNINEEKMEEYREFLSSPKNLTFHNNVFSTDDGDPETFKQLKSDYILQNFKSLYSTAALNKYGGISGSLVCLKNKALWEILVSVDKLMEGNCFDSAREVTGERHRIRRGDEKGSTKTTHGSNSGSFVSDITGSTMTGPSTFQGIKGSQIKVPDLVPSPKSNCYAFHCDYYKENYAWLILDPPNDKDIQIDVLYRNQRKDSEKNDKLKRAFAFKLSAGNVAGPAKDDHKIELKTLADVPFNLGNLHLSKNHVALLIKDLVGNRKRTTRVIRYGFSMTEVSTKDHRLIESGKTFTVSSVNTVDMKIKVKENELMLCVDWCPLESCKYQIMRQSNDIPGRIAYQLVAKVPCQIEGVGFGGHLTNNKLIGYARGYDCTPAKFRSLQCLVYDVTGENCDSTDRAVGYSSKYIALEPFDNLNFHNGDPNFRFCHGNIIDYLFNGGHWEQTGSSVDSSSSDEDVKRSVPEYRIKRSVSPDTDSPPECAGYFVGNSWPPRVTDMSLGKNVKICQTCRQSESGKDRYCFATLYNTDLRLPEYSAYTVHSLQSRLNSNPPAPISRKKVDSALWKRFEIGLCRESTKKKVPKKEWNSLPLVYEGNVGHTCKDLGAIGVDEHNNNIVYTYESGKIGHPCDPLYLDKQKCEDMQSSDSDYNVANNAVKGLWSRGHLNPSGIHNMVDIYMMQSTFTLTNAAPQLTSFNNGEWNTMECLVEHYVWYLRTHPGTQIVDDSQEVFIVTGTRPHATPIKIANNRLTSPEYYWTALCDPYFKRSLFFSGNNEPGFTGTTRIHVYDSLTSFQEWLWGSGTPNEIFPGKAEQCSNVIDLDMIPLTERCENELVFKNTPLDTISRRGLITLIKSINL